MNCFVTVNIGNYITDYARDSFLAACYRWHCDYVELATGDLYGYPSTAKWDTAHKLIGYENLLCIDGDCVVEKTAPNIFDLCVERDTIYAVTDLQAGNPNDAWRESVYTNPVRKILEKHPYLRVHPEERAFNAGVMLFKPTHWVRNWFGLAKRIFPSDWLGYQDQVTLNVALHNTPALNLVFLPLLWNHMVLREDEPMEDYHINHYGGSARTFLPRRKPS